MERMNPSARFLPSVAAFVRLVWIGQVLVLLPAAFAIFLVF